MKTVKGLLDIIAVIVLGVVIWSGVYWVNGEMGTRRQNAANECIVNGVGCE